MKIIFGDPHIEEKSLIELHKTFIEIEKMAGDELIMLGDYYNKNKPTAKEILFGTEWAFRFKQRFKKVIFLRGNHDRTQTISAIDYLQYLGIKIVDEYIDEDNNYFGHFMTNKSLYEYGTYQKTVAELKKYNHVILGHQHTYQQLDTNILHLGSVRYVNFNEVNDDHKYILVALNDKEWQRMVLDSPIPMKDVKSIEEVTKLEGSQIKVRLIISSYQQFKDEINKIAQYKDKFIEFKVKLDFSNTIIAKDEKIVIARKKRLIDVLRQGIEKIEDKDIKQLLLEAMK